MMNGYALLLPFFYINAIAQALFAIPSTVASLRSKKTGFITWLITLGMLVAAFFVWFAVDMHLSFSDLWNLRFWRLVAFFSFFVFTPQAAAYPLTLNRPFFRSAVAFGLGVVEAIAWYLAGVLSGATPD
jgi:hypothetical protein